MEGQLTKRGARGDEKGEGKREVRENEGRGEEIARRESDFVI